MAAASHPCYQLIARVLKPVRDMQIAVVNENRSEADILLTDELKTFREKNAKQSRIEHVLIHPSEECDGRKGHVDGV